MTARLLCRSPWVFLAITRFSAPANDEAVHYDSRSFANDNGDFWRGEPA